MRDILATLLQRDDVARLLGEMMRGLSTRYDLGSAHDAVGRLIADRPLVNACTLYDMMQDGTVVLLDATPIAPHPASSPPRQRRSDAPRSAADPRC